jgi:DNA-binding XRE family transcriptional regulator
MAKTGITKLDEVTYPRFVDGAGERMAWVRMRMLMGQKELAAVIGISQQQISKVEKGHLEQPRFTMAMLKTVFPHHWSYILTGKGGPQLVPNEIRKNFWNAVLKARRKPGSGQWKRDKWLASIEKFKKQK